MIQPRYFEQPSRIRNPRSARAATQRRMVVKHRARYTGVARVFLGAVVLLAFLMVYVVLTSNMTRLTYAVAHARTQREALAAETMRLDDKIAALRSDDRLAALAAKRGMREAQQFAVVKLPVQAPQDRHRLAVLSSLAGLFMPAVPARAR